MPPPPEATRSLLKGLLVCSLIAAALAVRFKLLNKLARACNGLELTPKYTALLSDAGVADLCCAAAAAAAVAPA